MVAFAFAAAGRSGMASGQELHWAYKAPATSLPGNDGKHPIDQVLEKKWRDEGILPTMLAAPRLWIERAAFTLTGLPPSLEQIRRIEADPREETWIAMIDELLATPAYGERWARHWMDVARYADTQGYNFDRDNRYPFAYTYRDWLIGAFNQDMGYGRFVQLQLAADLLVDRSDHPDLAALGFLTVGPHLLRPYDTIDEKVDVVTRGLLSSTVACARCHKHKTDPIEMEDYYSIYSIIENTQEPGEFPIIGKPRDEGQYQAYIAEVAKLDAEDRAARQAILDQLRKPESLTLYLEAAWVAHRDDWDIEKATAESFRLGGLRPQAVMEWRRFLRSHAINGKADQRLAQWASSMQAAKGDVNAMKTTCALLAHEWTSAPTDSALGILAKRADCPLAHDLESVRRVMHQEDENKNAERNAEMKKLQGTHPGSPPRAMIVSDRKNYGKARTYKRGNPSDPEAEFERKWLGFLGGGAFAAGKSPRLALAEKIADPQNPLTPRVMVNRVWGWHFGVPLADPGDFGPQQSVPTLLPLLDLLAIRFKESSGSLKDLHRFILTSRAFRLSAGGDVANDHIDEANVFFWKWNRRRSDFESMRDRILMTAGALDLHALGGQAIALDAVEADRRRSIYAFIDRLVLPTTFVSFDLPHPDHHSPKRAETTVPQQALWFLNGPMILRQSVKLAQHPEFVALANPAERIDWLYKKIHQRTATENEKNMIREWLAKSDAADFKPRLSGVWRVLHAEENGASISDPQPFPMFANGAWKTGNDLAKAPIPWLHAGANGGHAADHHALVLRWYALGAGEARMRGNLKRSQKGGFDLAWNIDGSMTGVSTAGLLKANGESQVNSPWVAVKPGDYIDFILRAPQGSSFGGFTWDMCMDGRETPDDKELEISLLKNDFPNKNEPLLQLTTGDPWADVIHMMWSSNEFYFIE